MIFATHHIKQHYRVIYRPTIREREVMGFHTGKKEIVL